MPTYTHSRKAVKLIISMPEKQKGTFSHWFWWEKKFLFIAFVFTLEKALHGWNWRTMVPLVHLWNARLVGQWVWANSCLYLTSPSRDMWGLQILTLLCLLWCEFGRSELRWSSFHSKWQSGLSPQPWYRSLECRYWWMLCTFKPLQGTHRTKYTPFPAYQKVLSARPHFLPHSS